MRRRIPLYEALKPSEFRRFLKLATDVANERIKEIWPSLMQQADGKNRLGTRLYFNISPEINGENIPSKNKISEYLKQNNYGIIDFSEGLVYKRGSKSPTKIGKVLTMLAKDDPTANYLLMLYNREKSLMTPTGEYVMVVSRHPYDVAGMSTDRNWRTCRDIRDKTRASLGQYEKDMNYLELDIQSGSFISYLVMPDDKNIKNPISRILIRPYVDVDDPTNILYGVELTSVKYGLKNGNYVQKLMSILDAAQNKKSGIFELDKKLEPDVGGAKYKAVNTNKSIVDDNPDKRIIQYREGMPYDKIKRWYPWVLSADIENVIVIESNNMFTWVDGSWYDGIWENGIWINGTWHNGTWENGHWGDGDWLNGTWENGVWYGGNWYGGKWVSGKWYDKKTNRWRTDGPPQTNS